jgi:hypothetical protein
LRRIAYYNLEAHDAASNVLHQLDDSLNAALSTGFTRALLCREDGPSFFPAVAVLLMLSFVLQFRPSAFGPIQEQL